MPKQSFNIEKARDELRRLKLECLFDESLKQQVEELQKQIDYFDWGVN